MIFSLCRHHGIFHTNGFIFRVTRRFAVRLTTVFPTIFEPGFESGFNSNDWSAGFFFDWVLLFACFDFLTAGKTY
ncbi:MAG: hypothetical protein ACKVIB_05220 [Pseudomonadales bacterium]